MGLGPKLSKKHSKSAPGHWVLRRVQKGAKKESKWPNNSRLWLMFGSFGTPKVATWLACYRMGNGPITKNGRRNGRKMAGQMVGQPKIGQILAVRPSARPFFGHFGTPPPEKWPPAIWPAAISPAIFGYGPISHSVAGQPNRNPKAKRPC